MPEHHTAASRVDVIIVGAGPVGLFLACELRLGGVSVLVLERAESPRSALKSLPFGMRGLTVPTIEAFHRRGLLDALLAPACDATPDRAEIKPKRDQPRRQAGHFAGIPLEDALIDPSRWTYHLHGPADRNRAVELERVETVLADRAQALGAEIRHEIGVDGFSASNDGVVVQAAGLRFEGGWLVGCDGGRSVIRKAGGFAFVGTDPDFTGYSVQVEVADPTQLALGRHLTPTGMYMQPQPGYFGILEFDGGAAHRTIPLTIEHVQAVLRRISQTDVTLTALHIGTSWTDRAQQATAYRNGRVLLAGDAAHIHAPLGGQGLNLGLGDAMNLGWKLAATVRGDAPDGLLDTYAAERHPIGAAVLDWSRAQVAIMRPTPHARAMEAIVRDLAGTRDGSTYFAERIWSVSLRHDFGGCHPLVGRSAPDFAFDDGMTLGARLGAGKGLLLDFEADAPLRTLADDWNGRLGYVAGAPRDQLGLSAVFVRPDGLVAWACDSTPDRGEVAAAIGRWIARPVPTSACRNE